MLSELIAISTSGNKKYVLNIFFTRIIIYPYWISVSVVQLLNCFKYGKRKRSWSLFSLLTRFSTKILVIRLANGGRAGGWAGCILNGVKLRFPLNNFSLLWPIDTKLAVWVAYIKRQLGIATQVSVIKVKVTVTKNRNSVSAQ